MSVVDSGPWHGLQRLWCPALGITGLRELLDYSGNKGNGTISGLSWGISKYGHVLQNNDATGDNVSFTGVGVGTAQTLGVIYKSNVSDTTSQQMIWGAGSNMVYSHLAVNNGTAGQIRAMVWDTAAKALTTTDYSVLNDNLIVGTAENGGYLKLYVNGNFVNQIAIGTMVAYPPAAGSPHLLSDRHGTGWPSNGDLSLCFIYNRALAANEIKQLYADPLAWFWPVSAIDFSSIIPQINRLNYSRGHPGLYDELMRGVV